MALSNFTSGVSGSTMQFQIQRYVGAYSHEAYTAAKKLSGTALVGASAEINTSVEDFIGQFRWYKPSAANINVPSVVDATDGAYTETDTAFSKYAKTVRTYGAKEVNIQKVVSQEDGLAKIAKDFGEHKAQDEHNSVLETLNGVALAEVTRGGGVVSFTTDADNGSTGFFVDINAAWKDYEAPFYYMVTSPETLADLRNANLVDQTIVTEGNLEFSTIFNGKFRLLLSRALGADQSGSANVNDQSVKTTFIVRPQALAMEPLAVPMPVEMDRSARAHGGSGTTDIWYRWGYVVHPMGYNWAGSETAFVATSGAGGYDAAGSFVRGDAGYLNLGILPIMHA
jgi:hypothetical protein